MNRKAMVMAVGAALAAPSALAQYKSPAGSDWELYGKFYPEWTLTTGGGATPAGDPVSTLARTALGTGAIITRPEMQISNSYLGFRASKDVGGGYKAIAQIETTVPIDEGVTTANSNGFIPTLANRDSFAGIAAGWGTVRLGNMDTPFKKYGDTVGFLGVSSGNFVSPNNVMRRVSNSAGSSFNLRRPNAVDYASPNFSGAQLGVQYSIGNPSEAGGTAAGAGTATGLGAIDPTQNRDPRVISVGVKWEQGPFYFAIAGERHYDLFGGSGLAGGGSVAVSNTTNPNVNSKDGAVQATAVFKVDVHSIEVDVIQKQFQEYGAQAANGFQNYKNFAYELVIESRWSNQIRTSFAYIRSDAGSCAINGVNCNTSGMDAKQFNAGVAYFLDPSVYVFALYSRLINGSSARFNNSTQGSPNPGEDITQAALGLAYTF
jgi:general bacterial porin, GBP family